jgi:hypothetical protein
MIEINEQEMDKFLIDTSCMDCVQTIQYVFDAGYQQAVKDMLHLEQQDCLIP